MTEKPIIIIVPSEEQSEAAFERYALALGKVAYSWNHLHENLANLFVVVVGAANPDISCEIWYSTENDRVQRKMLEKAANVVFEKWPNRTCSKRT